MLEKLKRGLPDDVFTKPPLCAAMIFTLAQTLNLLFKPDTIYVPLVVEIPTFLLSYIVLFLATLVLVPITSRVMAVRNDRVINLLLVVAVPIVLTVVFWLTEVFKTRQIFKLDYLLGIIVPSSVLTAVVYRELKRHGEKENHEED